MKHVAAFDEIAADYDHVFTSSAVGQRMRAAVWRRLDEAFRPGERVLELNCGTGEDAVYLAERGVRVLATDVSASMIRETHAKVDSAGVAELVQTETLAIEDLAEGVPFGPFDGVLSNFGGLNCVADLPSVGRSLGAMVRPGARALLCLMGPVVPWEWGWYLARGQPRKAMRRLRRGGSPWHGLTIRYPSIGTVRRAFSPCFELSRVSALGAFLPPPFAAQWAARHPRLLAVLDRCERRVEAIPPLPWLADHYLIELERRDAPDDV